MLFNSVSYLCFFPAVVLITFLLPEKFRYLWLLAASYYFYMSWNASYGVLIFIITLVTYVCGAGMAAADLWNKTDSWKGIMRQALLCAGLLFNFGLLFYYKYTGFLLLNIQKVMTVFHWNWNFPETDVLLPPGISFFTFQAAGYMIDVYRKDIRAEKNPFRYALFVSFFPQLVAGPVERSSNLLMQLKKKTSFDVKRVESGLLSIGYGLFLKIVLADNIALLTDPVYDAPGNYTGMQLLFANLLFAVQIYCDFEGYTQMALGSASILGYRLNKNFDTPYFAYSVKDFWRRWHISLTGWFRDYLYIPLGGGYNGKWRKYKNTMIVFLCSGLWHGAAWKYVLWGVWNGFFCVLEDMFKPVYHKIVNKTGIVTGKTSFLIFQRCVTFVLTDFAWLFFRAGSLRQGFEMLHRIISDFRPGWFLNLGFLETGMVRTQAVTGLALLALLFAGWARYNGYSVKKFISDQQIVFRWIIYWSIFMIIIYWGAYGEGNGQKAFIYFQF